MTVEAALQCAKDREEWRALVHMIEDYDSLEVSHYASPVTPINYLRNCTEGV